MKEKGLILQVMIRRWYKPRLKGRIASTGEIKRFYITKLTFAFVSPRPIFYFVTWCKSMWVREYLYTSVLDRPRNQAEFHIGSPPTTPEDYTSPTSTVFDFPTTTIKLVYPASSTKNRNHVDHTDSFFRAVQLPPPQFHYRHRRL